MRRVLAIARLNLLELVRDRSELVGVVLLPLLLTWVFGVAFGSQGAERPVEIPVVDLDSTAYSKGVVERIETASAFDVRKTTEDEARRLLAEGDVSVAVILPKGFGDALENGDPARVEVLRFPASQSAQAAAAVVEGAAGEVSANVAAARVVVDDVLPASASEAERRAAFEDAYRDADALWKPDPPVGLSVAALRASEKRTAEIEAPANTQYSLGFTVFFVFMVALGSAGGVLEDRELGTLRRVLAAPARRAEVLGGKVLGVALVAAFEAVLLVGFGALVFGVPWGKSPAAVALLLLALVLASTGLGVMLSAIVRTRSQMSAAAPILSTALAMLGGCYWSIEIASPAMQTVAKFTPTGWAMEGLKDVVARGAGVEAVLLPVAVLVAFAAVSLGIGITRLRLE